MSLLLFPCLFWSVSLLFTGSERETWVTGGGSGVAIFLTDFPAVTSTYLTQCLFIGKQKDPFLGLQLCPSQQLFPLYHCFFLSSACPCVLVLPFPPRICFPSNHYCKTCCFFLNVFLLSLVLIWLYTTCWNTCSEGVDESFSNRRQWCL